jgi:hypothetical protein
MFSMEQKGVIGAIEACWAHNSANNSAKFQEVNSVRWPATDPGRFWKSDPGKNGSSEASTVSRSEPSRRRMRAHSGESHATAPKLSLITAVARVASDTAAVRRLIIVCIVENFCRALRGIAKPAPSRADGWKWGLRCRRSHVRSLPDSRERWRPCDGSGRRDGEGLRWRA